MVQFAEVFPDPKILTSLMTKLGWTHFLHLIRLDDPLKRDFYAEMCRIEKWNTRTLHQKIQSLVFSLTYQPQSRHAQIGRFVDRCRNLDELRNRKKSASGESVFQSQGLQVFLEFLSHRFCVNPQNLSPVLKGDQFPKVV